MYSALLDHAYILITVTISFDKVIGLATNQFSQCLQYWIFLEEQLTKTRLIQTTRYPSIIQILSAHVCVEFLGIRFQDECLNQK